MIKWLAAFVRGVDSLNKWAGKVMMGFALLILAILLHEVVVRKAFNDPTIWGVEVLGFILAAYFMLGGGYGLFRRAHVRMDVFYHRWSPRTQAVADLATFPLAALYMGMLFWVGGRHALTAIMRLEHAATTWGPPIYPLKTVIPVAAALLLLQVIAFFIRDLFFVLRGKALE